MHTAFWQAIDQPIATIAALKAWTSVALAPDPLRFRRVDAHCGGRKRYAIREFLGEEQFQDAVDAADDLPAC